MDFRPNRIGIRPVAGPASGMRGAQNLSTDRILSPFEASRQHRGLKSLVKEGNFLRGRWIDRLAAHVLHLSRYDSSPQQPQPNRGTSLRQRSRPQQSPGRLFGLCPRPGKGGPDRISRGASPRGTSLKGTTGSIARWPREDLGPAAVGASPRGRPGTTAHSFANRGSCRQSSPCEPAGTPNAR